MEERKKTEFEEACKAYLFPFSIIDLRVYGRYLGVTAPTKLRKTELIHQIVQVLCDGKTVSRTKKGAPIKNKRLEEEIPLGIDKIRSRMFGEERKKINVAENTERNGKENIALLQFSIAVENLTKEQRQLLRQFLNSL